MIKPSFLCLAFCLFAGSAGVCAREPVVLDNGNIRLENRFLTADISPDAGGRILALTDKRNGLNYTAPHFDDGIGGELNWRGGQELPGKSPWYGKSYRYTVDSSNPAEQCVTFSRNGSEAAGNMKWITIHKTFRLGDESSVLRQDYRIEVEHDAMRNVPFSLWLHSTSQVKGEPAVIFLPTDRGVERIGYDSNSPANESFTYRLTGGWSTLHLKNKNTGIAYQADYPDLMCFYNWQGSSSNSMEYLYRTQSIPNGKSFNTTLYYTLYTGLAKVDGAGNGWVGSLEQGRARIYCPRTTDMRLKLFSRVCPGELEQPVAELPVRAEAGTIAEVPFRFAVPAKGIQELIARLTDADGKTLMTMTLPVSGDKKLAGYARRPDAPPRGNLKERYGVFIAGEDELKDCFDWNTELGLIGAKPWIKPYSGGTIRLLALTGQDNGRELIELAGRMDANLSTCSFSGNGRMAWNSVWGHNGGHGETNQYLRQLLKENYDCILLSGIQIGNAISPENMKLIAEKVKNGTALVSIMPTHIPAADAALFPAVPELQQIALNHPEAAVQTTSLTNGAGSPVLAMPMRGLPEFRVFPYHSKSAVIHAAGRPLLSLGKFGKGNTALLSWLVGRDTNTSTGGVMPFLAEDPLYPFQNYYYGMIIKTILNAADRLPAVRILELGVRDGKLSVSLENRSGAELPVEFVWEAFHRSSLEVGKGMQRFQVKQGRSQLELPLDWKPLHGDNFVDLRLRSGEVGLDFGVALWEEKAAPGIGTIAVPKKVYGSGDVIAAEVKAVPGSELSVELFDLFGRKLNTASGVAGGDGVWRAELPLRHLYANYGRLVFALTEKGRLSDRRIVPVDLVSDATAKREWDQFQFTIGWPRRFSRTMPFYLFETYQNTLRDLGFNAVYGLGISMFPIKNLDTESMTFVQRGGFRNIIEAVARIQKGYYLPYYTKWGESDYNFRIGEVQKIMEQYSKTHDTKVLRRNPSLDSDEYLADYSAGLTQLIRLCREKWFASLYDLADEYCYTWSNAPVDFDFSPESLAKFRGWLRTQYRSLEELNTEWKREFRSWDEVLPDTGWEARNRGIYSGWAMHRLYNNKVFADFVRISGEAVRKGDPDARISLSGTRAPAPYTGCDWSMLMPSLDALFPYDYDGQGDMHRSFKKIPMSGWSGYVVDEEGTQCWETIWRNAFSGHFGVAVFSDPLMIAPDLTPTLGGRVLSRITEPLRNGVGSLLFRSERPAARIALHYSYPSIMGSWIEQQESDFIKARLAWSELLKSLGFEFVYLTGAEIENGKLQQDGFRFLILPHSFALSDRECEAINTFAEQGGGVIADLRPGKMNQRCAPAAVTRLDRAFDASGSLLLNRALPARASASGKPVFEKIKAKLSAGGINSSSRWLTVVKGEPKIYPFRLSDRGGDLVGFWCDQPAQVRFAVPEGHTLYDVMAGGVAADAAPELKAHRPSLFAMLPYQVDDLAIEIAPIEGGMRVMAKVIASNGKPGRHVLRFACTRPDGGGEQLYSRVVEAPEGTAEHEIFPALNEGGEWTIHVRDVISGKEKKVRCTVPTGVGQ